MQYAPKTRSNLAKLMLATGLVALSWAATNTMALADQPAAPESSAEHSIAHWLVTYPVGYSDLDVSKLKGAKTLYLRIRHAAEMLCESTATWGKKEGEACVRKAVDDAVARVNAPPLTQYTQLRSKGDNAALVQLAKAN